MKIRSLLLGSVAAAGLTTGGYAADLGVLTSLDVCDSLGLSGLTISSETTCLQISGSVDYRLRYGDYRLPFDVGNTYDGFVDPIGPDADPVTGNSLDWDTRSRAYLQVVASSESDFGRAAAVIGFRQVDEWRVRNEGDATPVAGLPAGVAGGDHTNGVQLEEAYVSVGDSTVIMIGKKKSGAAGSVVNVVDDAPYSFLFMSEKIDGQGVILDADDKRLGGHSIQVESDLGNGVSASIGLENIDNNGAGQYTVGGFPVVDDSNLQTFRAPASQAGTLIGVLEYKGDGITAHVSGLAYGVLDGDVDAFALHAGATAVLDQVELVGAVGYDSNYKFLGYSVLHALASARISFDMFKIAVSGEVANLGTDPVTGNTGTDWTLGARLTAEVTDGVTLNLDGSWFHDDVNPGDGGASTDTARIQADAAIAVTETVTLTAAVGGYFGTGVQTADENLYYGKAGVAWAPGGDFNSAASIEINDEGGWRSEVTASKKFQ